MQSISPVFTEAEQPMEKKVAEHQEEYFTVIGLPVSLQLVDRETGKATIVNPWGMSFRFRLDDEERAAVAAGKDLILTQLHFGRDITPMNVQFCAVGEKPSFGEAPPEAVAEPVSRPQLVKRCENVDCSGCEACNPEGIALSERFSE